jgi:hypothetical protein
VAKSAKKRTANLNGVKRVSKDRVAVGIRNFQLLNKLSSED